MPEDGAKSAHASRRFIIKLLASIKKTIDQSLRRPNSDGKEVFNYRLQPFSVDDHLRGTVKRLEIRVEVFLLLARPAHR